MLTVTLQVVGSIVELETDSKKGVTGGTGEKYKY